MRPRQQEVTIVSTRLASPLGHVARTSTFGIKLIRTALNGETCMMKGALRFVPYVFLSTLPCEDAIETGETVTKKPVL